MKYLLLISLWFLSCNTPITEQSEALVDRTDSVKMIGIDSLIMMAHQTVENYKLQLQSNKHSIDSLAHKIVYQENLSATDKAALLEDLQSSRNSNDSYASELDAYKENRIVRRDSIIYNFKYIDSTILRFDTLIVCDTVFRRIKIKRRK